MKKSILIIAVFICIVVSPDSGFSQQTSLCRNGLNRIIPDLVNVRDSMIFSVGTNCQVLDINIVLDTIYHTWVSDLRIYIQKGNVGVKVIDNVGGSGDNFIHTILDDSATVPVSSGTAPFTGRFRPSNPLTPFNGVSTDGYWKILITDSSGGDTGMLKAWCVQLVYQCPTGGIQSVEIPNSYRLHQNYPNPFNPKTIIKYGIPVSGNVKLTVYDISGNEIAVLVNESKPANMYEVEFDAGDLASGVYFYKLTAGVFIETKKMLVVK